MLFSSRWLLYSIFGAVVLAIGPVMDFLDSPRPVGELATLDAANLLPSLGLIVWGVLHGLLRVLDQRRAWREANCFCVKCGYDLTGNTSGFYPECGETI